MELFVLIFSAAVIVTATFLGILHARRLAERHAKAFNEKYPPISDEEFLARCTPGTNPYIALKVRRVLSECLGIEYERIYPESRLAEDLIGE
jgi:hypothetical protein